MGGVKKSPSLTSMWLLNSHLIYYATTYWTHEMEQEKLKMHVYM